ncbi:MAG: hypothetical protein WB679_04910 [Terracidiphilus sp.]
MIHRDQVHGDVRFDPMAVALLNTSSLQRLGRVYQLGYAHLVYRGGTHTRLSHVMGASHVAGWLVDQLRQNYLQAGDLPRGAVEVESFLPRGSGKQSPAKDNLDSRWDALRHLVSWAALLHDVGHVPLGHTLEDEFEGIYEKHDDFASPRIPYLWLETAPGMDSEIRRVFKRAELLPKSLQDLGIDGEAAWQSVMLICLHKEKITSSGVRTSFKTLLNEKPPEGKSEPQFVRILKDALKATEGKTFFPYMADIVGNTICADYFDYLRRDPTNVGLDVLRDNRVAARFFVGQDANQLLRMALALVDKRGKPRLDTCTGVVELVRQRFRFAEIIYYHKTKVAASAMLAKAFNLIGKPDEIGPVGETIDISQVQELAQEIVKTKGAAASLKSRCSPNHLLSPEIGDETLLFWLQQRGWDALSAAAGTKDPVRTAECLRGLSLLQGIAHRNLYKVSLTIDQNTFEKLCTGSHQKAEIERAISEKNDWLRKNESVRRTIETSMANAAGWPQDSLLLYVPPRKSQAKGIETGALDGGGVVTLGAHSAVIDDVTHLNEAYKGLWRIILLVHPKYSAEDVGLSNAVEALLEGLWPDIDLNKASEALADAAWFTYIPKLQRPAAHKYQALISPRTPEWRQFISAGRETSNGTVNSGEHALRAVLLLKVLDGGGSIEMIRDRFANPDSLSNQASEFEKQLIVEGREGDGTKDTVTLAALDKISNELLATHQPSLFRK